MHTEGSLRNIVSTNNCILLLADGLIAVVGGEKLRSLEIASHQTLIRDVAFTESLIPNRSKYLALKLCQALAPLFIRKMIVGDSARTSIWEEHQEVLNDMEARMQRIFAMALELKAESVLTDQTFVFLVHQPGTQTLGANTNASRLRSAETAEQMGLTRSRPWLHATLMIYPPSTSSDSSGVETATVCTRNFRVTPDGIEAGDCLYKRDILIANHEGHAGTLREGFACSAARELPPYVLETHGENHGTVSSQANNGSKASFNIQDQPVNEEGQDPATTNIAESLECDRCGKHFKQALYRKNHQKNGQLTEKHHNLLKIGN
jgi:hypothetical protein